MVVFVQTGERTVGRNFGSKAWETLGHGGSAHSGVSIQVL